MKYDIFFLVMIMVRAERQKKPINRIQFLDALRGICILSMAAYHTMWDCVNIIGVDAPWFNGSFAYIWQQSIGWTFIFLSGFCINLGKKKIKRGITVFICGAVVSIVTYFFMPEDIIIFGVLTLIGTCMLITALTEKTINKIPPAVGMILNFLLFAIFKNISKGYIGLFNLHLTKLPEWLYSNYFTAFLGMPYSGFRSADYYPLLPWIFLFLTGYFTYKLLESKGISNKMKKTENRRELFTFLGRNSLWIYMIHQHLIYGILYIIFKFTNR